MIQFPEGKEAVHTSRVFTSFPDDTEKRLRGGRGTIRGTPTAA